MESFLIAKMYLSLKKRNAVQKIFRTAFLYVGGEVLLICLYYS